MAGELLTLEELQRHLGDQVAEDGELLDRIRLQAISEFVRDCHREHRPFQDAESGRVEVRDGTGTREVWVDYPVGALTALTLGRTATPDETLDVSDPEVISWKEGDRRIVRVDGGVFGCKGSPNYVRVTYDAQADLPVDAANAVKRRAAAYWRESGTGEATAERRLGGLEDLPLPSDPDGGWDEAVTAHQEIPV